MIRNPIFYPVSDANAGNWSTMQQSLRCRVFTPTLTGFTGVTGTQAYYVIIGPLVYLSIILTGTISWTNAATIEVPLAPHVPTTGTFAQEVNPVIDLSTMTDVDGEYPIITKTTNKKTGTITIASSASGLTSVKITGLYLRN